MLTDAAGWYDLSFASPVKLAAGNYWNGVMTGQTSNVIGFRYDNVSGARDYNANTFSSGPSNPFGSVSTDGEQTSLYATYTTQPPPPAPVKINPPTMARPSGRRSSEPVPVPSISGRAPRIAAIVVIMIGRNRISAA